MDIVKELRHNRHSEGPYSLKLMAADEIERLRASEIKTAAAIEGLKLNFAALVLAIEMK